MGEALPVHKHRETPAATTLSSGREESVVSEHRGSTEGSRREKKTKKDKKDKKDKSRKERDPDRDRKGKARKDPEAPIGDLIGLDVHWPSANGLEEATPVQHPQSRAAPVAAAAVTGPVTSSRGSQKAGAMLPLFSDKSRVEIYHIVQYLPPDQLQVSFRVKNISSSGLAVSSVTIGIDDQSAHAYRVAEGKGKAVARNVEPGGEKDLSVIYSVAPGVQRVQTNGLWLTVQVAMESLLGTDTSASRSVKLPLPPDVFLEPHELSREAYMGLLASATNPGPNVSVGSAKVKRKVTSSKPKKTFRSLLAALKGHEVEYEDNRAMSVCAKVFHQGGAGEFTVVCVLLKLSSSLKHITVDIKCFGRDAVVCQRVADEVVSGLEMLSL